LVCEEPHLLSSAIEHLVEVRVTQAFGASVPSHYGYIRALVLADLHDWAAMEAGAVVNVNEALLRVCGDEGLIEDVIGAIATEDDLDRSYGMHVDMLSLLGTVGSYWESGIKREYADCISGLADRAEKIVQNRYSGPLAERMLAELSELRIMVQESVSK